MTAFAQNPVDTRKDGILYCDAMTLPAAEGSLFNLNSPPFVDPFPTLYDQAIVAAVELSLFGNISSNSSYVVMQGELGDLVYFDLAWCVWTGTSGTANFLLTAGAFVGNSVQQTRAVGTAPGSNGSIQVPLPGRIRFVGKATVNGSGTGTSPSPSPGTGYGVRATIRFKQLGLR